MRQVSQNFNRTGVPLIVTSLGYGMLCSDMEEYLNPYPSFVLVVLVMYLLSKFLGIIYCNNDKSIQK